MERDDKNKMSSPWDLTEGPVPFRKSTWRAILSENGGGPNLSAEIPTPNPGNTSKHEIKLLIERRS